MKIVVYTLYQFLSFALTFDNINYISNKKMYLPLSTCFCHFDPFSMIVTDKKAIVFFPNPVIMFSFRKNKMDIRNLDF